MNLLDLFCGTGGTSDGFAKENFNITGIDIINMKKKGYKYNFIQADIQTLSGLNYKNYDVIWSSPPCRDFSNFVRIYGHTWKKNPPNIPKSLELINHTLKFIQEAQPKFWILENVANLAKYF